jgi:7,8-dihydroneopterin aldolase/epimerase/oxygenase
MDTRQAVTLQGMRFHAKVGVLTHEIDVPQPVEIDLTVWRDGRRRGEVIDYRALYEMTETTLQGGHIAFLEEIADRVVEAALGLPGVSRARVAVRKPHVALPGPLSYAEVVLEATPDDYERPASRPRGARARSGSRRPARGERTRKHGR